MLLIPQLLQLPVFRKILTTTDRELPRTAAVLVALTQSSSHLNMALVNVTQFLQGQNVQQLPIIPT